MLTETCCEDRRKSARKFIERRRVAVRQRSWRITLKQATALGLGLPQATAPDTEEPERCGVDEFEETGRSRGLKALKPPACDWRNTGKSEEMRKS